MEALKPEVESKATKRLRKKLGVKEHPPGNNPLDVLRVLVNQHRNTVRMSVSTGHMALTEVIDHKNGGTKKRDIPVAVAAQLEETSKALSQEAQGLKSKIKTALKDLPIYEHFFADNTFAVPMLAAYLAASVDVQHREQMNLGSTKPSHVRRFCGLAIDPDTKRLERLKKGEKRKYNATLRTQLYLAFEALWKNQRHHTDNKYLKIWKGVKHRALSMPGVEAYEDGGVTRHRKLVDGKYIPMDGFAHSKGWHAAADVFIEDMYIVWRALLGLPIWPDYHAAKLGYSHGGKVCVDAPRAMTLEEAKLFVRAE